jgi:transposase-like protein
VLRSRVTMGLTTEGKKLRAEIAAMRPDRRRRYSPELRRRILDWVDRAVQEGANETACGKALGLPMHRFGMWRRYEAERASAREPEAAEVALVPIEATVDALVRHGTLVLVTPRGYRVEGVTMTEVIAMLKELR